MMKIAFLHLTCGFVDRGSEVSTQILASYFSKKKHQVVVYQAGKRSGREDYQVKTILIPFLAWGGRKPSFFGKIFKRLYLDFESLLVLLFSLKAIPALLKNKPDVLIPTNGFWQMLVCRLLKVFTGVKIVVIGRAGIGWHDKHNLKLRPDLFIALSKKASFWAKKINPNVKVIFLPNAIDIDSFLQQKAALKLDLPRPVILSVASLSPYKNIDKLILACVELKNASCLVAGQGELYDYLKKMGSKKLGKRFLLTTFPYDQMASLYKACDLFVLLSEEREAFGRVFLEAMACGLTVVTADYPERREILGAAGIYVSSFEEKTLALALKKALKLKKPELGLKQVKKFSIEKIGPQYEEAFLRLLKI